MIKQKTMNQTTLILLALLSVTACKKSDVKPTETKTVKTTTVTTTPPTVESQYFTITVEGVNTQIKVNGFQVNTNYFQCKKDDELYVYSETICSTKLNSDGTVGAYECSPNNKIIITKNGDIIVNKTCSCNVLEHTIKF